MNAARRKQIAALKARFDLLNYADMKTEMESIKEELENLKGEEDDYKNNMPENMQNGDRGQAADECISAMESIGEALDGFVSACDTLDNDINFDAAMGQG